MNLDSIYTVNDLLIAAADALNDCDLDRLEQLKALIDGWLQADDETKAQLKMLDAMIGACDRVVELLA